MILKVKYRCDKCPPQCPAEIAAEDAAPEPGNGQRGTNRVLTKAGWMVLVDGANILHYCPDCKGSVKF